jgi:hypothetical protein
MPALAPADLPNVLDSATLSSVLQMSTCTLLVIATPVVSCFSKYFLQYVGAVYQLICNGVNLRHDDEDVMLISRILGTRTRKRMLWIRRA